MFDHFNARGSLYVGEQEVESLDALRRWKLYVKHRCYIFGVTERCCPSFGIKDHLGLHHTRSRTITARECSDLRIRLRRLLEATAIRQWYDYVQRLIHRGQHCLLAGILALVGLHE